MKRGATEHAKHLIAKAPKTVVEQFEKQYEHSMAAFARVDHSMAYDSSILFIKEVHASSSEPISCKAGCGACCHQPVFTSYKEFETLRTYLIANDVKIEKSRLEVQVQDIDDMIYHKATIPERRCVFLGDTGSCTIYEARPIMCRRHIVYSDPKHCASGMKEKIKFDVSPRTEGHLSAYFAYYGGDTLQAQLLATPEVLK